MFYQETPRHENSSCPFEVLSQGLQFQVFLSAFAERFHCFTFTPFFMTTFQPAATSKLICNIFFFNTGAKGRQSRFYKREHTPCGLVAGHTHDARNDDGIRFCPCRPVLCRAFAAQHLRHTNRGFNRIVFDDRLFFGYRHEHGGNRRSRPAGGRKGSGSCIKSWYAGNFNCAYYQYNHRCCRVLLCAEYFELYGMRLLKPSGWEQPFTRIMMAEKHYHRIAVPRQRDIQGS